MKPIQLNFKQSILASLLYTVAGSVALVIVLLMPLTWQLKLLLSLMILVSVIYSVSCYALRLLPWSVVALKVNNKNQLYFIQHNGKQYEVSVKKNTTVTAHLTVLNANKCEANFFQRYWPSHLIIFSDEVDVEAYRQFRTWLRWHKFQLRSSLDKSVGVDES